MLNNFRGIQGRLPDDPIDNWFLARHHHDVPHGRELWHGFHGWHGVTQSGPLSAKLFNILVNAVVCEWVQLLEEDRDYKEGTLAALTSTFFAIF
jgi:hypothetical protein